MDAAPITSSPFTNTTLSLGNDTSGNVTGCSADPLIRNIDLIGGGIIVPSISFVGIVFNIINLIVLASPKLSDSTYTYLTGLAVADLGSLFFFGVNYFGRAFYCDSYNWRWFEVYLYWTIGTITTVASVVLTVTVTIERFIFIYLPHRARTWCAPRIARIVTLTVWFCCVVVNIPRFFIFTIDEETVKLSMTSFGKSLFYNIYSWLHLLVISFGAAIVLILFNILLIMGIHKTHKRRQGMTCRSQRNSSSQQRKDETRLTKTLIGVIFLFIIGEIPSALTSRSVVVATIGQGDITVIDTFAYKVAVMVATILVVAQLSLNFIIYCVFNRKFWAVFRKRLCPCILQVVPGKNGTLLGTTIDSSPPRKTDASCHTAWASDVDAIALRSVDDGDSKEEDKFADGVQ